MKHVAVTPLSLLCLTALLFLLPRLLPADVFRAPKISSQQANPAITNPAVHPADILDIYDPIPLPDPPPLLLLSVIALIVALIVLAATLAIRKKKQAPPIPPDPTETALADLQQARLLLEHKDIGHFIDSVSHILRAYIEASFDIRATRLTTQEFFALLKDDMDSSKALLREYGTPLKACLSLCDEAKFAGYLPPRDRADSLLAGVRSFIETTRSAPRQQE